jgi:hypothetical protein
MHGHHGLRRDVYTLRMECEMRESKLSVIMPIFRTVFAIFQKFISADGIVADTFGYRHPRTVGNHVVPDTQLDFDQSMTAPRTLPVKVTLCHWALLGCCLAW